MNAEFLDNTKKKKLISEIEEQYGIDNIPFLIIETGKDKYRIYSGELSKDEIKELSKSVRIEFIGSKICKKDNVNVRLNFDMLNLPLIKEQINKNIVEINEEQIKPWLKGENVEKNVNLSSSYLVVKNKGDFLGMGQNGKTFIKNYVPKERRVKG
ncbi:MAG: hypothetical protein WC533_03165 [Candidatus Pacearchaeota archaeon]